MKTSELRALVRQHYGCDVAQGSGWALFDEVRNETGWTVGQSTRTCDMLALSLWRSKGIELHGIELKVSRGDWLRELRQPDKAGAIAKYVDFWWLVVPSFDVAKPEEMPPGWGLMVVDHERVAARVSRPLTVVVKAPKRDAESFDRTFIAALVRKVVRREFTTGEAIDTEPVEVQP